jgi:hypothetical protein
MSLWIVIGVLGFGKVVMASVMLWVTLRTDSAKIVEEDGRSDSGDDGGSKVRQGSPTEDPHPRRPMPYRPRRGPHGSPSPDVPRRIRVGSRTRAISRESRQ